MSALENRIRLFLSRPRHAALATLTENGAPWVRYVTVYADEALTLRFCTAASTRKAQQIRRHPAVHLVCGELQPPDNSVYLQVSGRAVVRNDAALKNGMWRDEWRRYFRGADDPEYVIVEVQPETIEYYGPDAPAGEAWRRP